MTDRLREQRLRIYALQAGRCATCGRIHATADTMQLAHRVAKTKTNIRVYGRRAIDHDWNKAMVCAEMRGGLDCNAAQNIGNKPASAARLMAAVGRELARELGVVVEV
jgi:hypothetical protein